MSDAVQPGAGEPRQGKEKVDKGSYGERANGWMGEGEEVRKDKNGQVADLRFGDLESAPGKCIGKRNRLRPLVTAQEEGKTGRLRPYRSTKVPRAVQ